MKHSLIAATISSLLFSAASFAESNDEHTYKASAELGFLYKTGNSKSGDIKAGFDLQHEYNEWRNDLKTSVLYRKTEVTRIDANGNATEEFEASDQKLTLDAKTNYSLGSNKDYLYGSLNYVDDRFSSFDYQATISAGWGKKWYETDKSSFFADIGPGFKRDRLSATDITDAENKDAFVIQGQALYTMLINEHVEFKQLLRATQAVESDENSVYRSETTLTTKLIETLQVKFSFIVDHNTEVAQDKENTDTQTAVTLIYSF